MVCRICGAESKDFPIFTVNDKMFQKEELFNYFECSRCGTLQIRKIPEDMSVYYPDNYYSLKSEVTLKDKIISKLRDYILFYNFPSKVAQKLSVKIPNLALQAFLKLRPVKSVKVLDVGCGEGKFLKSIYGLGFKNVIGIEPFALHTQLKPFPILKQNLKDVKGTFDVITFNHVFEHVENVHETLQDCKKLLSESGKIILRIPVKDSFAFEFYKENWIQWDAPRHFQLLTKKALEMLSEANGFFVKDYYCDSYKMQFTGSEKYKRGISYQTSNAMFSKKEQNIFIKKAIRLNKEKRGDQVVAVLRESK